MHVGKVTGCYAGKMCRQMCHTRGESQGTYNHICLCKVWIRQNPLWLWNPEETSPEVQNRGISGPTNGQKLEKQQQKYIATSCVRAQHATTVPAEYMWETGTLNWTQFMLQWLSVSLNSVKVTLYLGKTPVKHQTEVNDCRLLHQKTPRFHNLSSFPLNLSSCYVLQYLIVFNNNNCNNNLFRF